MDVTYLIELLHTGWAIATKDLSTPDLWIWISLVREIGISGWELLHGSSPVRWAWSEDKKREYANDLTYDGHLIAVKASANRSKGSNGPEFWKPPERAYWCRYAVDWITIKNDWELTATEPEAAALGEMLDTCEPSQSLAVVRVESSQPNATPTPTPVSGKTYASCDEAEDADEPRVRGSKGNGRGFAAAMVPSARDGDGDGVVCER